VSLRALRSPRTAFGSAEPHSDLSRADRSRGDLSWGDRLGDVPVLADGQPIGPAAARQLACDAGVVPVVLGDDSEPLDLISGSRGRPPTRGP
jgi:hypothetical protein